MEVVMRVKTRILLSFDQMPGGGASPRAADPAPPKLWWDKPYREGYSGKATFADYGAPYFLENVQIQTRGRDEGFA